MSSKTSRGRREALIEAISIEVRRSQNRADAFDEAVSQALGINRTDMRCLDIIEQEGGRLSAGRLAERAGLTSGAMTTVIDRLERSGYARRVPDESDRRRVLIELTDAARREIWPYYEPLAAGAAAFYADYSDDQLELVLDFLRRGSEFFEPVMRRLEEEAERRASERRAGPAGARAQKRPN